MSAVLEVEGLVRHFGGIVVADSIDFEIASGEVVGLIGPNGAGKTTLFNLMTGFVIPDAGTITLPRPADRAAAALSPRRSSVSPAPGRARGCSRAFRSSTTCSSPTATIRADRSIRQSSIARGSRQRSPQRGSGRRRLLDRVGLSQRALNDVDAAFARPAEARRPRPCADERRQLPLARRADGRRRRLARWRP